MSHTHKFTTLAQLQLRQNVYREIEEKLVLKLNLDRIDQIESLEEAGRVREGLRALWRLFVEGSDLEASE